jgi:hypothetical protein
MSGAGKIRIETCPCVLLAGADTLTYLRRMNPAAPAGNLLGRFNHMRRVTLAAAAGLAMLAAVPCFASDATDVMGAVDQYVQSYNKGDLNAWNGMCAANIVIIDDFTPHVWQGANACSDWWHGLDAGLKHDGITDGAVTHGKALHLNVSGGYAYVVLPSHFTFKKKGKTTSSPAVWTLTLHKTDGSWKITGWAWAKH